MTQPTNLSETLTSEAVSEEKRISIDVGEKLRQSRHAQGFSIDDVARDLRIDVNHIQALENNDFDKFPSPVFVKGYLRNYARLVKLDAAPLIDAIDGSVGAEAPSLEPLKRVATSNAAGQFIPVGKILSALGLVVGVVLVVWLGQKAFVLFKELRQSDEVEITQLGAKQEGESLVLPGQSILPMPTEEELAARPISKPLAENLPAAPDESHVVDQSEPSIESEVEPPPSAPKVVAKPEVTLTVSFNEDSWVEVYDADENRLLTRLGKVGTSRTITGTPPLRVVLGNAKGVSVQFNGEPYDPLVHSRSGQVARFTLGD